MKRIKNILAILAVFAVSISHASSVHVTATYSLTVEGGVFSKEPSKKDREAAALGAKRALWNNYASRFSQARAKQISANVDAINSKIDEFVSNFVIVDEEFNPKSGLLQLAVRALIDETKVDSFFGDLSAAGKTKSGEGSSMAFIFLARKQAYAKEFDARRTTDTKVTAGTSTGEVSTDSSRSQGASSRDTTSEDVSVTKSVRTVTSGSVERKSADIKYVVSSSEDIDAAMSDTFTTGGFELSSYSDVLGNCEGEPIESIKADFAATDELAPPKRKRMLDAAQECLVRYMAIGTLDVGVPDEDPVSGLRRVVVSVRGQVMALPPKDVKRLPIRVASVGPVQFSGLGTESIAAERNALAKAAKETARNLVDQLNAKGIR